MQSKKNGRKPRLEARKLQVALYHRSATTITEKEIAQWKRRSKSQVKKIFNNTNEYKVNIFIDNGSSGLVTSRVEFQKLCNKIQKKEIEVLVVENFSRIARSASILINLLGLCFKNKVRVITIDEKLDSNTPYGQSLMEASLMIAMSEKKQRSFRMKEKLRVIKEMKNEKLKLNVGQVVTLNEEKIYEIK